MSGLVGSVSIDETPVDGEALRRMLRAIASWGPDRHATWQEGPVGLGHAWLRTSPSSSPDSQPLVSHRGEAVIVADARIDNRAELTRDLLPHGAPADAETDASLLLRAHDRWGSACVQHFVGDFAFVVWDRRRRQLFAARDPLGVKPLYYSWDGRRLLVASSVDGILADPAVPKRPNESLIADYLLMRFSDSAATGFDGVAQLPPAHHLQLVDGHPRVQAYWELRPDPAPHALHTEEAADQFRDLFREAVRCRMADSASVGLLLSGGIDSTTVAAMVETLRADDPAAPDRLALTVLLDGFLQEEWEAIQALAQRFGTPLQTIHLTDLDDSATCFEWFLETGDTPHYDQFFTLPVVLEEVARRQCRVLLTGFGADELSQWAEQGFVKDVLFSGSLRRFAREYARWRLAYGSPPRVWQGPWPLLWTELPPRVRRLVKQATGRAVPSWMNRDFARRTGFASRSPLTVRPTAANRWAAESIQALTRPSMGMALGTLDAMSARFSVECRHPYLDRRLVEWFISLPPEVTMSFGYRKQFVQHALRSITPVRGAEQAQEFIPWTNDHDPASHRREATRLIRFLSQENGRVFEYVDRRAIQQLLERFAQGQAPASTRNILWNIAKLQAWLQRWFA